jgi:hypothetical protein
MTALTTLLCIALLFCIAFPFFSLYEIISSYKHTMFAGEKKTTPSQPNLLFEDASFLYEPEPRSEGSLRKTLLN